MAKEKPGIALEAEKNAAWSEVLPASMWDATVIAVRYYGNGVTACTSFEYPLSRELASTAVVT